MSQAARESAPRAGPLFSVIMPVYNHASYVRQAVESVRRQTFADWELLVVDDGSTDGSLEAARQAAGGDPRVVTLRQENAGQSAARNAGLARSRGPWIAYLDSDDVWMPEALEIFEEGRRRHPQAAFLYGFRHRLEESGQITPLPPRCQEGPTGSAELFEHMYLSTLCLCHRRELLDRSGPWDESLRVCEDYDLYLRMSLYCRFQPIGRATGLRRRHKTNVSRRSGFSRMVEAEVLRRFVERRGGSDLLEPARVRRRLHQVYRSAAAEYARSRDYAKALWAVARAHRYARTTRSLWLAGLCRCLRPLSRDDGRPLPNLSECV